MIVIVEDKETEEQEAYLNIERIYYEAFNGMVMIIEGFNKEGEPRAKFIYKKEYKLKEITEDAFSYEDEEIVKQLLQEKQIKIHECL